MRTLLFWVVVVCILVFFLFPIIYVFMTALKEPAALFRPAEILFTPTLDNFRYLVDVRPSLRELGNSILIAFVSTALVMGVSLPAAYSFARFNPTGGHLLFVTISTRMFPGVVAALPFFLVFRDIGLLDTHLALILLYLYFNMSFATFLLYGFFREIPAELENAAMLDGYGRMSIFQKIVLPLIKPGAAITAVFCLIFAWNEFFFAYLFTRRIARTVSVGLSAFWGSIEIQWGPMAALMALAIIPTLLATWFMQRYIVRGLTFGAVKG